MVVDLHRRKSEKYFYFGEGLRKWPFFFFDHGCTQMYVDVTDGELFFNYSYRFDSLPNALAA